MKRKLALVMVVLIAVAGQVVADSHEDATAKEVKETIMANFEQTRTSKMGDPDAISKEGTVEFHYVDFQNQKNAALTKAYKITGPSLSRRIASAMTSMNGQRATKSTPAATTSNARLMMRKCIGLSGSDIWEITRSHT